MTSRVPLRIGDAERNRAEVMMAEAKPSNEVAQPAVSPKVITALTVATTLAWIAGAIICSRYDWDYWYVLLVPSDSRSSPAS